MAAEIILAIGVDIDIDANLDHDLEVKAEIEPLKEINDHYLLVFENLSKTMKLF
jgi:hypothetical protein